MKKCVVILFSLAMLSAAGFADRLVGLNANGELWQGDSDDIAGTKTLLATLTGTNYIDSAFDGQYLYGLRDDGEVYRSDLSGNVSAVSLTGWSSDMLTIKARSGTLYGMKNTGGDADVLAADGTVALHVGASSVYSDFATTDDGRIWVLLTTDANKGYVYGYTNGYSGAITGFDKFLNLGGADEGLVIVSDGTELYGASDHDGISAYIRHSTGGASTFAWSGTFTPEFVDMDAGSVLFAITTNGVVQSMALTGGSRTFWGDLSGTNTVSIQVVTGAGYSGWEFAYGLTEGTYGDDDGDGQLNVYEYGLGGDPTNSADVGTEPYMVYGTNDNVSFYNVVLTDPEADITYIVEQTPDLVSGTWTNSDWNLVSTNTTGDAGFDEVQHRIDGGDKDQLFLRLRITQP